MARITEEEAKRLGIKLKPQKEIADLVMVEVRGNLTRESKFGAERTEVDEIDFDSKKEAERYRELKLLEKAGEISHLKLQPKFLLQEPFEYEGKTEKRISYIADFSYCDIHGTAIVEDVKGMKTEVYRIKRKLFLKRYGHLYKFIET